MPLIYQPKVKQVSRTTPIIGDVFKLERIDSKVRENWTLPSYGTAHQDATNWPNHRFVWATDPDAEGIQTLWYVADRTTQQAYNWEFSDETDFPTVTQTFVILRADYDPTPADPATTYPPPSATAAMIPLTGYEITGYRVIRSGEPTIDNLYVIVNVRRENVAATMGGFALDSETGLLVPYTRQKVAAGTAGLAVGLAGTYAEVRPTNTLWSIKDTRQAAGLAGQAVNGVASRTPYNIMVNFPWPPVLDYVEIVPLSGVGGDSIRAIIFRPVWRFYAYNGPCLAEVTESWSLAEPVVTASTPMLPLPIEWQGGILRGAYVPPSLHAAQIITESSGTNHDDFSYYSISRTYPATNVTEWPASVIADVQVTPMWGGYFTRTVVVNRPSSAVVDNTIRLTATGLTNGIQLDWTRTNNAGTLTDYFVTISSDPNFAFNYIVQDLDVNTALTYTSTSSSIVRGAPYYARIKATFSGATSPVYSNIAAAIIVPAPRIQVEQPASTILVDGTSTIDFGTTVEVSGGTADKTFTIRNIGEYDLSGLSLALAGTNSADWTVQTALGATTVSSGGTTTFTLRFNPSALGARSAQVDITSNDPSSGSQIFTVLLTGTGVSPEISVEYPALTVITTSDWGTQAVSSPVARIFTIRNSGTSDLTGLTPTITGAQASDFQVTGSPTAPVAPAGTTTIQITFTPGALGVRQANLAIASNDIDENPYNVALQGEGV